MKEVSKLSTHLFKNLSFNEWDIILENFETSINYTSWFLNYIEVLNVESRIQNHTFVIYKNEKPIVIVPLYIENIENTWQISMGQEPVFAPVFSKNIINTNHSNLYQYLLKEIDRLAKKSDCKLARFQYSPLLHDKFFKNYYNDFGFIEGIFYPDWYIFKAKNSFIIDLNKDVDELYRSVRKSNKPHINKTRRETKCYVLDSSNFDQSLFDSYIALYIKVKGKKRSLLAFSQDEKAIKSGLEVIILCEYNKHLVGAIALHTFSNKARYNSSIQDSKINRQVYPNHFLLWQSILYLKEKGFKKFEVGEQIIYEGVNKITDKEKNLSHFKSGWGGNIVPWVKVEKSY